MKTLALRNKDLINMINWRNSKCFAINIKVATNIKHSFLAFSQLAPLKPVYLCSPSCRWL